MVERKTKLHSDRKYPSGVLTRGPVLRTELVPITRELAEAIQSDPTIPRLQKILASRGHILQDNEEASKHKAAVLLALKDYYSNPFEVGTNEFWRHLANSLIVHHVPSMRISKKAGAPQKDLFEQLDWVLRVRMEAARMGHAKPKTATFTAVAKRFSVRKQDGTPHWTAVRGYFRRGEEVLTQQSPSFRQTIEAKIGEVISATKKTGRKV